MAEENKAAAAAKNKKINRLKKDELKKKIDEIEQANHVKSRYYRHLMMRAAELG
ncbi:MAG: hypothetical protein MUC76_01780 [Spirochaetes bacterium]|jgi:hypothetical protein|nr:hypothetical protein [Spirochaetota bacterium]